MNIEYKNAGVKDEDIPGYLRDVSAYREKLVGVREMGGYGELESSVNLIKDKELVSVVKNEADKSRPNLKYIFLVGIGGSNMGTLAVYDALFGHFDKFEDGRFPKIISIDSVEPNLFAHFKKFVDEKVNSKDEFVLNIISKSGKTIEVLTNAEIIIKILTDKFDNIDDRIFVTSGKDSGLWNSALQNNWQTFEIPEKVGGRFSVFSSVGLFPLALCGIDIEKMLAGAEKAFSESILPGRDNIAMISASIIYHNFTEGKKINDNFFFNPELESLGKWYRQLLAESIGKEEDLNGRKVNVGVTPTVSIGSKDLHSVGQLYLAGPKDKLTIFIRAENVSQDEEVGGGVVSDLFPEIIGKKSNQIVNALFYGTKRAYATKKLPFMEINLGEISSFSLGWFMQFKMMEVMYLANLLNVNAFDGPGVELYKIETKKALN